METTGHEDAGLFVKYPSTYLWNRIATENLTEVLRSVLCLTIHCDTLRRKVAPQCSTLIFVTVQSSHNSRTADRTQRVTICQHKFSPARTPGPDLSL